MWRKVIFFMLLVGVMLLIAGQKSIKMDAYSLLVELGEILPKEIPEKKEECQTLLKQIKAWQQRKLEELKRLEINIIKPKDGGSVSERPYVRGTVADPNAKVWVIVHPMEVSNYWVQPRVSVKKDGTWKVCIYVGRPGSVDVGKHFEIMAVANPKSKLKEGDILNEWSEARWESEIIEVVRK